MIHSEINRCLLVTSLRWARMSLLLPGVKNLGGIVHLLFSKDVVGVWKGA